MVLLSQPHMVLCKCCAHHTCNVGMSKSIFTPSNECQVVDRPFSKSLLDFWSDFLFYRMCCQILYLRNIVNLFEGNVHSSFCRYFCTFITILEQLHSLVDMSFRIYAWNMYSITLKYDCKRNLCIGYCLFSNRNI